MKKTFLKIPGLLLVFVLLAACSRKANQPVGGPQPDPPAAAVVPAEEPPPQPPEGPAQVAGFQKTPCYGKCPVYQAWFYADGKVKWYGRRHVERMGWHEAKVDATVLKEIGKMALQTGFFDLEEKYPVGYRIADLPSTVTFVRFGDKQKQVTNTHDAPENLKTFEKYLENLIESLTWTPTGQ